MAPTDFPANPITTPLDWSDLVLPEQTRQAVSTLRTWLEQSPQLLADEHLRRNIKPGYRALFYGPSGTGKTLTAALLGKATGHLVYRVDLARVVSKFIGETEKNLARAFDLAEQHNGILLFDEAEALFGKRTSVSSAHDRYANIETAYLLQRMESFSGAVIAAAHLKDNLDPAFIRRFQAVVYFPLPAPPERLKLWQQAFTATNLLAAHEPLNDLAEKYPLSGGAITNVLRHSVLAAQLHGRPVSLTDVEDGIKRELAKENGPS